MIEAFPLCWPAGYPRVRSPERARFGTSFAAARDGILREIRLLRGAVSPIISSNVPIRRDGIPYAGQAQPRDPGVAVYFTRKGKQVVIACDRWAKIEDNLHAVELTIAAMRGLDRWGCSDMLERAFTGFTALPAPSDDHWAKVLGVPESASLDEVEAIYRVRVKRAHPDAGGSHECFIRVQKAIEAARAAKQQ